MSRIHLRGKDTFTSDEGFGIFSTSVDPRALRQVLPIEGLSMTPTSAWPAESTMIPDLLEKAPQARGVLDRYGLQGCGGAQGPAETLAYFARAHEVPLAKMLDELREACGSAATPTLPILDSPQPQMADAIYRPFFKAGIAVALTLGAMWGAWLLLRIALTGQFTAAGVHDVNAHGHAQIFGWVGLFVMGFAYQAFPRFKHASLAWPRLAFATLGMMLTGIIVRSVMQPLAVSLDWAYWPAVAASVLEIVAIGLFVAILAQTWRRSGHKLAFYDGYIISALGWFLAQAVYESVYLAATLRVEGERLLELVAAWQPALRDMQIHGFALLMILGVSQRIFHHFYGLKTPSVRLSRALLVVLNLAIAGEIGGLILMRTAGRDWSLLWYGSALVLAASTALLAWDWRIYSRCDEADRSLKFLRAGYAWLLVSLAMLAAIPLHQFVLLPAFAPESDAAAIGFSHAYYGAIRHAITVGFVSLMIVGVASKVTPTLNGIPSARLSQLWAPFVLINLGCALRVLGQTATDFTSFAFPVAGASGLLEVTGLALWGGHMWLVMSGRARIRPVPAARLADSLAPETVIEGRHAVGAVLERWPRLLDVFLSHGFTMLASPQLRATIARVVTIERACRRMGVDVATLLEELNEQRELLAALSRERPCCDHCAAASASSRAARREETAAS
jgi:hypothetical protein